MKVGIIGLGDIAKKAYLPVLSEKEGLELVLCTRNIETLEHLSNKYRIARSVQTVDELISQKIDAAFVSAATDAHYEIAQKLLMNGIHVYIDKPISMKMHETKSIIDLAQASSKIAMVGFNRRFVPRVKELKGYGKPNLIIIQKNRFSSPDHIKRVIFDDFIHVVDSLRFLMDTHVKDVKVEYHKNDEMLNHVIIQLIGEDCIAIGIMNRNGGVNEEIIEYHTGQNKYVVHNLTETTHYQNKTIKVTKAGDWEPTLFKRGFYQIVDHFLDCVQNNKTPNPTIQDSLITHEICEKIVDYIDQNL